ncbi:DNA mismatch repair protein MutL [Amylocarpus encephaloides]|uniref:DNA mismatch repair protein PMS1 n=1 Tax=Amylocarpus encephaloides TaxID=45428 RepID=A0A9P7YSB0_9HELO|nr:DNA mismatch repair protein MutL [Amylocarpus encephaloides]
MATIKAIEGRTIHQIQSGQVIVDLCSVVKELVENSLDAAATSIDVRFKNQGLDSIEVQDNGDGITPQNYETLALKHHTSKLSTYSDLTTLQTFGFRGEALSSLCALSQFSVTTCMASDAPKGARLDFEVSGRLKNTSVVAAQKGTTMSVENLFNNLPVRRRELERNIKREWGRVVGVLGQYACIQTGIKFSVTQQAGKGKKTTLFSTKGNKTTRENIVNVYGAKTLSALLPLDLNLELEATSGPGQRWSTQEDGGQKDIRIVGHISRPASGEGRQTPDRQMFFVNARPCGLPQVAKAFNEVYKTYNGSQSPFIFANIELDTHLYDVNVSPDKRTILLHDQVRMLENLKEALIALFDSQDYTVPISQLPAQRQPSYKQLTISRENSTQIDAPSARVPRAESSRGGDHDDRSQADVSKQNDEDESIDRSRASKSVGAALSSDSMSRDRGTVNLISNWAGRKAEDRTEPKEPGPRKVEVVDGLSKEKRRLVVKLGEQTGEEEIGELDEPDEQTTSMSTTQSSPPPATYKPPIPVADFNERVAELQKSGEKSGLDHSTSEPPIPALQCPSKSPPSLSSRFSTGIKPHRGPSQMATITIGDHTVTSSIGTPCPKRAQGDYSVSVSRRRSKIARLHGAKASVPSFGDRLSQRFGARGISQPSISSGDESDDVGDDTIGNGLGSSRSLSPLSPKKDEETEQRSRSDVSKSQPSSNPTNESIEAGGNTAVSISQEPSEIRLPESSPSPASSPTKKGDENGEYLDEQEKKAREEAKVQEMIEAAEEAAAQPSQANTMRAKSLLKGGARKKDSTVGLAKFIDIRTSEIERQFRALEKISSCNDRPANSKSEDDGLDSAKAEEKLSLTISKPDFAKMKIIGQFNLGFILATRFSDVNQSQEPTRADDLFIIDQHASDEKYNFERLQSTTIVQSQRLVHPKTLDLTALEEEIVLENLESLETNGFIITVDQSGESPIGQRCQVVALPLSRETTFTLEDLDELLALLTEHSSGSIPRPSKVRKMFAMRACRSSIMIGKTLTHKQMGNVVRHMGEIDKPWNCPHGRPTMRHLCGLGVWDDLGWKEGDSDVEMRQTTNLAAYIRSQRGDSDLGSQPASPIAGEDEAILDEEY